jgi:hypothetical protein
MQHAVCITYISPFSALYAAYVLPVAWLTLQPRRWRRDVALKHDKLLPDYCGITFQKVVLFITSMRPSDPTFLYVVDHHQTTL